MKLSSLKAHKQRKPYCAVTSTLYLCIPLFVFYWCHISSNNSLSLSHLISKVYEKVKRADWAQTDLAGVFGRHLHTNKLNQNFTGETYKNLIFKGDILQWFTKKLFCCLCNNIRVLVHCRWSRNTIRNHHPKKKKIITTV